MITIKAMKILVTGGNGYIGRKLALYFGARGHQVVATVRNDEQKDDYSGTPISACAVSDLLDITAGFLKGYDAVIHAAGRAHKKENSLADAEKNNRRDNLEAPVRLAELCRINGVRRLIVIGSIGAALLDNDIKTGKTTMEETWKTSPYRASKLQADIELRKMLPEECAIVRLPMLYGKFARGNFSFLSRLVEKGIPLPVYGIRNQRAFVAISTLCSFVNVLLDHPQAAERIWEIRDANEISTPDFVCALADALHVTCPLLFPFPPPLIKIGGRLFGMNRAVDSLFGNLHIDLTPVKDRLGWQPAFDTEEGLMQELN